MRQCPGLDSMMSRRGYACLFELPPAFLASASLLRQRSQHRPCLGPTRNNSRASTNTTAQPSPLGLQCY